MRRPPSSVESVKTRGLGRRRNSVGRGDGESERSARRIHWRCGEAERVEKKRTVVVVVE